jgi:type II secretory pathway component PulC
MPDGAAPAQAVIEEVDSGQQHLLSLNDAFGDFRLTTISRDGVVLTGDHCTGEVALTMTEGRARKKHDDLAEAIEFDSPDSTHLEGVRPGSLVERLGIRPGDILATVNGHEVSDAATAKSKLSALSESDLESIGVRRDDRLTVFVNPNSTTFLNYQPPSPEAKNGGRSQASSTAIHGMVFP